MGEAPIVTYAPAMHWLLSTTDPTCMPGDTGQFGCDDGSGFGDTFAAFFVIALLVGIGITVYKVSMARKMAQRSGMDEGEATAMTLLSDDGLDATYLASNLRPGPPSQEGGPGRSVTERLAELESLKQQGLVTQAEYDERRAAILESL
jgi:hypothetical protein